MVHVGEPYFFSFMRFPDSKNFIPNQVFDLGFQVDHVYPKKSRLFESYREDSENLRRIARFFFYLNKNRGVKLISDGNKSTKFKMKISFKKFMKEYN